MEAPGADKPKRTRKTHSKVRTGCLTCKTRRKKCDEGKPFCNRCISTGRKCDGYESVVARTKTSNPLSPPDSVAGGVWSPWSPPQAQSKCPIQRRRQQQQQQQQPHQDDLLKLWRPPRSPWFQTDMDYFCFDFFRHRTCPQLGAYFDSCVWRYFILRACFLHPTVLLAASAVGAVHRRFELGITPEAFRFCDISVMQCRKALAQLEVDNEQRPCNNSPMGAEMRMVVSLLLAIFETFQGNYEMASDYLTAGIKGLICRPSGITTHTTTTYKAVNIGYESLHSFTDKLEAQAHRIFGSATHILSRPSLTLDSVPSDPIPKTFTSLEHARDVLFTEGAYVWDAWVQLELGNLPDNFSVQHKQVTRLLEWSLAYAEYLKTEAVATATPPVNRGSSSPSSFSCSSSSSSLRKHHSAAHLLKVYREALYLIVLTQLAFHESDGQIIVPLCSPPETCGCHASCISYAERKSTLNAHLARLIVLAEPLFDLGSSYPSSSSLSSSSSSSSLSSSPSPGTIHNTFDQGSLCMDSGIDPPLFALATSYNNKNNNNNYSIDIDIDTDPQHHHHHHHHHHHQLHQHRSTKARHQVTSLLAGANKELQQKVWSCPGVYGIAERLGSVEEQAVIKAGVVGGAVEASNALAVASAAWSREEDNRWIANRARLEPRCVDITCFLEEGRVLVRSCREDEFGGLIWRSEWISY